MRYGPEHKMAARQNIIDASGRGFRQSGFGGIGVDGLAKSAGVTSGAFYGHFSSKDEAFKTALVAGLEALQGAIAALKAQHGIDWIGVFVEFYLTQRLSCELSEACALQALTPDVIRANSEIKGAYEAAMKGVISEVASGLSGGTPDERDIRSWAILAFLSGSVSVLRGLNDQEQARYIAQHLRPLAMRLAK